MEVAEALIIRVHREAVGGAPDEATAKLLEEFAYFSTVTTLGTAQDVTLQELRIECFFPMDDETVRNAEELAL